MRLATPTAALRSTRSRPCSTWSSTKQPTRSEPSQGWGSAASSPYDAIASSRRTPRRSRRARASSHEVAPVASREPRQASPNRDPSSSTNTDTPIGRAGGKPRSRSRSTAASAETTPSGPSYAPPSSTESRCEPVRTRSEAAAPGASHHATTLPYASDSSRSPRARACSSNQPNSSRSEAVNGCRKYPPDRLDRPTGSRSRHIRSKSSGTLLPMEFQDVVNRRRMIRNYADTPVDRAVVDRALRNATRAPSAGFSQGWAFVVLDTAEDVRRFWDASTDGEDRADPDDWLTGMMTAPVVILPCSSKAAYLGRYAEADKGWTDHDEARWPMPFWHMDAAMASLLILQTAVDEGLGSCFFGVPPDRDAALRAAFDIPDAFDPVGAITLGHPAASPGAQGSPSRRRRRNTAEVVHRG